MDTENETTEDVKTMTKRQVLMRFFWYQSLVCLGLVMIVFVVPSTLLAVAGETDGYGFMLGFIGFLAILSLINYVVMDWMKMRLYNNILKQFDANPEANAVAIKDEAPTEK